MRGPPTSLLTSAARGLMVWLLAVLTPLQGIAAVVIVTLGPAHVHAQHAPAPVLEDFRRGLSYHSTRTKRPMHGLVSFGHSHAQERHHHARSDTSVVADAVDLKQLGGLDDATSGSSTLVASIGLIPFVSSWVPIEPAHPVAMHVPWAAHTHHPPLPKRPPRLA